MLVSDKGTGTGCFLFTGTSWRNHFVDIKQHQQYIIQKTSFSGTLSPTGMISRIEIQGTSFVQHTDHLPLVDLQEQLTESKLGNSGYRWSHEWGNFLSFSAVRVKQPFLMKAAEEKTLLQKELYLQTFMHYIHIIILGNIILWLLIPSWGSWHASCTVQHLLHC